MARAKTQYLVEVGMGLLKEIVIDADHPAGLARFWCEVLTDYRVMPYDADEIARLAALGLTPETDPVVMVAGPGPRLCFHQFPGPRPGRNRLHLDVAVADRAAETRRLQELGAVLRRHGAGYTVLADPEGNNFCLVDA
jgi:hypothetical protein